MVSILPKTAPILAKTVFLLTKTVPVLPKTAPILAKTVFFADKDGPNLPKKDIILTKTVSVLIKTVLVLSKNVTGLTKTCRHSSTKTVLVLSNTDLRLTMIHPCVCKESLCPQTTDNKELLDGQSDTDF